MSVPPGVWSPVTSIGDVEVRHVDRSGARRVELVDRRLWVELVSLPPAEAVELAELLTAAAGAPGRHGHEPGGN